MAASCQQLGSKMPVHVTRSLKVQSCHVMLAEVAQTELDSCITSQTHAFLPVSLAIPRSTFPCPQVCSMHGKKKRHTSAHRFGFTDVTQMVPWVARLLTYKAPA